MNRYSSVRVPFALLLCLSTGMAGCTRAPLEAPATSPTPVTVSYPVEREVTDYVDFTGQTAAVDSVQVRAHVWGFLDKVNFKEGALVEKDDVLFEIDPRTYQAALDQAKADLESKQAATIRAEALYKRTAALVKGGAASREDVDKDRGDWLVARANIAVAEANLHTAALNLGFTRLTAPISGRVSRTLVTKGNLVQSGDQGGGTLLTTIVSVDPMYAYFDVDERTVLRVRQLIREGKAKSARDPGVKLPVLLGLANEDGLPHRGTLDFVDNQINPKTGTLRVRGVFPNADEALSPGLFARIRVPIGEPHKALLITERALDTDQGQRIVYLVNKDNKVVSRTVRLGAPHDGLRVIEDGLNRGERVIVNGLQQVRPGAAVEPTLTEMPTFVAKSR
jgi:RND family efflux transporter MFP subunit